MKKRSITLIIWLMSIALIGVMAMQYYFIRESYKQKSQLFDEAVGASLAKVAGKIETQEVVDFVRIQQKSNQEQSRKDLEKQAALAKQVALQQRIQKLRNEQYDFEENYRAAEQQLRTGYPDAVEIENSFYETYIRRHQFIHLVRVYWNQEIDPNLQRVGTYVQVDATQPVKMVSSKDDSTRFIIGSFYIGEKYAYEFRTATLPPKSRSDIAFSIYELEKQLSLLQSQNLAKATNLMDTIVAIGGKTSGLVEDVAIGMELSKKPLGDRLKNQRAYLVPLIASELASRDIYSPFIVEIIDNTSRSVILDMQSVPNLKKDDKLTKYSTSLFQSDVGRPPGQLAILFPNKSEIIRDTMGYMLFPMAALLILLIGAFTYTLKIIFRQKKVSEMKTDFINNMTHEFKTPVATIMIASESLKDPEISADENRVNRLANIIYDENVRLGSHIERVLNIAKLEKETIKIERVNVHINDTVSDVLESMHLQLEKANGQLIIDLSAKEDLVTGDELHLSNVFFNLVDNAIKYSKENPIITVKTTNLKGKIIVSVSDNGMGMTKDQQEKIFDQFYRIPTGNIHNVKGFGLGLSYVSDIIKRLNGKIQVKSEKDKGTQFDVTFPLKGNKLD
ncbi:sensor histidine kinase [Sphingobacterium hungaricum]|uniref:histidine kinase n=1 Tax=Sphingobacterium hungaricum TaxID=2082723 RepID=A0A928UY51_9SPHI|nr:HAMP domain-containing sensor histidine kinase [Sphingobacterium hungaricum]MBE8713586.1 sensor histidine kinase [Sphingobacterium hungaricum]